MSQGYASAGIPLDPQFQDWTPSYTNLTLGSGATEHARFIESGGLITVHWSVILGTSPTVGDVRISLPVNAASAQYELGVDVLGTIRLIDATGENLGGHVRIQTASTVRLLGVNTTGVATVITSTIPFIWAVSDKLNATFAYERV